MKRKLSAIILASTFLVIIGVVGALKYLDRIEEGSEKSTVSAASGTSDKTDAKNTASEKQKEQAASEKAANRAAVVAAINDLISQNANGLSVGVSLVDLNSGETYDAGETAPFKAASTAKVIAAVDFLQKVQHGEASLDQLVGGVSAQQQIQEMIEVSSDDAWHAMNDYLGDQQQSYAHEIGLSSFTAGGYNTMTAADMAKLLAMLYSGKLLNSTYTNFLLDFMAHTTSTNLIQAALPADATVYHKYGQVWGYLNDAAIVTYQKHQYVLVIYTNNSDGTTSAYDTQVDLMHKISQQVFQDVTGGKT